ncbi:MAG: TerC family protein, partial [Bryobacteraceae bacterium]
MGTLALWVGFNVAVLVLLLLDLGVFHRRAHAISLREALAWSVFWVVLSLGFNWWIYVAHGPARALEFLAGYTIEKSLSVDNIFIFVLLFKYFRVEARFQHRVLFWGIFGALVMRGAMIGLGTVLIRRFEWVLYLFGVFLVVAGVRMMFHKEAEAHPDKNPLVRAARKVFPVSDECHGQQLFIRESGRWIATPLLLTLLVIESTDLAFALDSIPAVFAVTRDPFIVYTSNVCAILGLRAFYFLLAGVLLYFRYLDEGLSLVLAFVGVKMLAARWMDIPTGLTLGVVALILTVAVAASIVAARAEAKKGKHRDSERDAHAGAERTAVQLIEMLAAEDAGERSRGAAELYERGTETSRGTLKKWMAEPAFDALVARDAERREAAERAGAPEGAARATVGVAVSPEAFARIRIANESPRLAEVPPDQDALE